MQTAEPRRARVYDRLEGQETLPQAPARFGQVDAAAQALRPGAVVALAFECDELLAVRRASDGGAWGLAMLSTEWSSRGTSGWHTHAADYAVESLEPHCLFRVLRDGPRIALASVAADGLLLCASSASDKLGLAAAGAGSWAGVGASWEQRDGAIRNSRWPDKALAVRLLHVTCLPTLQLQRCEEYYGGLLHELHSEKAAAAKRLQELEEQRDTAHLEARRWQHQAEELECALQLQQQQAGRPLPAMAVAGASACTPVDGGSAAAAQLSALQQQLESLASEGSIAELQQDRARMSICLQTIKDITDLVRLSASATPSSTSSPGHSGADPLQPLPATAAAAAGSRRLHARAAPAAAAPYATESEGESRRVGLRDYLGRRPEEADPLERVLCSSGSGGLPDELENSTPQRVLRALENAPASSVDPDSAPPSSLKAPAPPAQRPLSQSLTAAVRTLAVGSPHQANGMAQFMATRSVDFSELRGSQAKHARVGGASASARLRSSFLQRPPAAAGDLYPF